MVDKPKISFKDENIAVTYRTESGEKVGVRFSRERKEHISFPYGGGLGDEVREYRYNNTAEVFRKKGLGKEERIGVASAQTSEDRSDHLAEFSGLKFKSSNPAIREMVERAQKDALPEIGKRLEERRQNKAPKARANERAKEKERGNLEFLKSFLNRQNG